MQSKWLWIGVAIGLASSGSIAEAQVPPRVGAVAESTCGPARDFQDVELYDGTLGLRPLSRRFVDKHQSPVGQIRWNSNLGAIYTNPGDVNGQRWCTGTLIDRNLFLTAGHCFDVDPGDWTTPRNNTNGNPILPVQIATNMHVEFNFQVSGGAVTSRNVTGLLEYRRGGLDYAVLQLGGTPGLTFGMARIAATELVPGDELTIIQHPAGMRKQIDSGTFAGYIGNLISYGDIDTLGGSSGSGVLDWQGRLVGVHVQAGCTATGGANRAVDILDIVEASAIVAARVREHGQYSNIVATGDFDGNGFQDIATGDPAANVGGRRGAGRVRVTYSNASGPNPGVTQFWTQNSGGIEGIAEAGDYFGSSVASGDFNGDGRDDLAIGASGEGIGALDRAGAVNIIYGSASGLTGGDDLILFQDTASVPGGSEANDVFGASLAVGDFDANGFDDLAVGVPGEGLGSVTDAGAFHVFYGSASGLRAVGSRLWHQNSPGISGIAEAGDRLGESIAAGDINGDGRDDLVAGAPGEGLGAFDDVGAVNVFYGAEAAGDQFWTQNSNGIAGTAEVGDRFGASLAIGDFDGDGFGDLAVGVPGEALGTLAAAGLVHVIYGVSGGLSAAGNHFLHQNTAGVPGGAEPEDRFGIAVASGDLNSDGRADLVVGVAGESLGNLHNAGAIHVLLGSPGQLTGTGAQLFAQSNSGLPIGPERGDRMGTAVTVGRLNTGTRFDAVVSVPGEDLGTNPAPVTVMTFRGATAGLTTSNSQIF